MDHRLNVYSRLVYVLLPEASPWVVVDWGKQLDMFTPLSLEGVHSSLKLGSRGGGMWGKGTPSPRGRVWEGDCAPASSGKLWIF